MNDYKIDSISGNPRDGSYDTEFGIKDWMQGQIGIDKVGYKGLSLQSPVDGVSLISFVKYLEHQEWKRRMRK